MPSENMLCTFFWLPAMAMASEVELREEERMRRRISVASDSLSQSRMTESYRVSASLAEASAAVVHSSTLTPSASRIPRRTGVVASSAHTTRLFSAIRSHPKVTAGWRQVTRVTGLGWRGGLAGKSVDTAPIWSICSEIGSFPYYERQALA